MPLTSTGQFYPGLRRGVPFRFPGMPGANGLGGGTYDPGFAIGNDPASRRRSILNSYLNSQNTGFNGMQTMVNYDPAGMEMLRPGVMAEAERWHSQQPQQPQGVVQYAGGAQRGQPYQWGPFRILPGSPFHPEGNGWGGYFNPQSPPAHHGTPSVINTAATQQSAQQQFAAPPVPMPPPDATMMSPPPVGPMQRSMQQFGGPPMPPPMPGQLVPNSQAGAPTQQQIDYGRTLPSYYRSIGPENPSGINMANGGYYTPEMTSQIPRQQFTPEQAMDQNRQWNNLDSQWAMQYPQGQLNPNPQMAAPQEQGLNYPAGGTLYGGGSMALTLPNGRTALVGRRIVDEAMQNVPRDATAQQRQDAVLSYYQSLADPNIHPSNYGRSARTALGMRGEHTAYQGFTAEQNYNMARNRNIAQGGTGEGTYEEIMADNNRRAVGTRLAERQAIAEERRQQILEGRDIRREAILEGKYGPAAARRFAIENEARQQTQRNITKSQSDGMVPSQVTQAVPTTVDPGTGAKVTDASPNGFGTWMSNLETTRGEKWADEAMSAIQSGKVPWNREQAIAALEHQQSQWEGIWSSLGVNFSDAKAAQLDREKNRINQMRSRLGLAPWEPRTALYPQL